ncbi:MAG: RNA-binding domain-containing protein [Thermoplasmata archaeon]
MLEVQLRARCFPTEDRERIVRAITRLFPDAELSGDDPITGRASSAAEFGEQLKRQRIRDAARAIMWRGAVGNSTSFKLNKQVAAVGKISFSEEEHALGDIEVTFISDDLEALIDAIAPHTRGESNQ